LRSFNSGEDTASTGATPVLGSIPPAATSTISSAAFVWRLASSSSGPDVNRWDGA
jgi:hypothetical protein